MEFKEGGCLELEARHLQEYCVQGEEGNGTTEEETIFSLGTKNKIFHIFLGTHYLINNNVENILYCYEANAIRIYNFLCIFENLFEVFASCVPDSSEQDSSSKQNCFVG